MKLHVGTSGWVYSHWRGLFYPDGLAQTRWLEFYSQHFATVELNNSFYRLPSEKAFNGWRNRTASSFVYAVKVSRYITHLKRLKNVEEALDNFLVRARILGEKLGPLLYQLPPNMRRNDAVLEAFLQSLPGDLSHVFEFRHETWFDDRVFALLRRYNAGFCIYDMPGLTTPVVATADFAYVRFHGSGALYESCYSDAELAEWADRITRLGQGLISVYVYFNNDSYAHAVGNARTLANYMGTSADDGKSRGLNSWQAEQHSREGSDA
jgi:uncharacterized protein YecE (DUF72 family)